MTPEPPDNTRAREERLDDLREEARRTGRIDGNSGPITGGPIPSPNTTVGYYGQPVLKPPAWTWEVGLYLFIGGTAGMAGAIALVALLTDRSMDIVRAALGIAAAGALISPFLLIADLGRPKRFLNMLRVFKWRSPMSMGVWILVLFSNCAVPAFLLAEGTEFLTGHGVAEGLQRGILFVFILGAALFGLLLATYTGVLLGATAVPVWAAHHKILPFHFGIVALGSAAATLELLGFRINALSAIGLTVAAVETAVGVWIEVSRKGVTSRDLHEGSSGMLLRIAASTTGPLALIARLLGWVPVAALFFLFGAVCSRYGWLAAGRSSARDPKETFAMQQRDPA